MEKNFSNFPKFATQKYRTADRRAGKAAINRDPIMFILLISIVIGLFLAMLFLNLYFRVKVLRTYRKLVENRVEFGAAHLFNREKMEAEVMPLYPHMREEIETFVNHMRYSIRMATVLIALITLFGAILMYFRE